MPQNMCSPCKSLFKLPKETCQVLKGKPKRSKLFTPTCKATCSLTHELFMPKYVKNAEQVLFHSTLEPNTEVFSKVSCGVLRSTKFHLNFAKQRGMTCNRPNTSQDFCTHSNSKCTATLPLACSYRHERSEGRRKQQQVQSEQHALLQGCSKASLVL